jgi:hypothetical protein
MGKVPAPKIRLGTRQPSKNNTKKGSEMEKSLDAFPSLQKNGKKLTEGMEKQERREGKGRSNECSTAKPIF